ncbi:hypothetical protein HAZT_HAZT000696 [Hyalella azteca]|uniref:Dynein axonemal assembly factor 1 homolog n=1 Tax=Hyalella azteca TaxID=294128 RepID=A0A6A0H3V7_HYAAZ|nr:hypothetical protein HAZT_HAZT000696 [Hyalella azteca]
MADDAENISPDEGGVPSNHDSSDDARASPESESLASKLENNGEADDEATEELVILDVDAVTIENLDGLVGLNSLFLGKNKITRLQNLDCLLNLKVLGIQSNRITKIEGLGRLVSLDQLYLSHNGIQILEGLNNNTKLNTLDLACNRIHRIENISHLVNLEEFWVRSSRVPLLSFRLCRDSFNLVCYGQFNGNAVSDWKDIDELIPAKGLQTVYLEGNPIQQDPNYRRKLKLALPSLVQIDATLCR